MNRRFTELHNYNTLNNSEIFTTRVYFCKCIHMGKHIGQQYSKK